METLNEYEVRMSLKLASLKLNTWYRIDKERPDFEAFMMTLDARIKTFGEYEYRNDKTEFRKIAPMEPNKCPEEPGISYKIEYHPMQEQYDFSHLPMPDLKTMDHKTWEKLKGRSV